MNTLNYKKNNNIYNTNYNIFYINTYNYNNNNNIYNTNNNIFYMNILNYIQKKNYNTTQEPRPLGPDSGPNALGSYIRTYFAWVLREDPRKIDHYAGPKSIGS
jgi:hypothetical protein